MTSVLSHNTKAILLLTAPLIVGRSTSQPDLLTPGEYKRLALHLREIQLQPADLISPDATDIIRACPMVNESRLQRLLARGFLLSQVIERWQARAIWVVSRADPDYPRRLKARLRENAPAVLYGCGDISLLDTDGFAIVGSRHVDESLVEYAMEVGRLSAYSGQTLVSGGAKGIDQAAMRGALEAGGKASGVLADSLEKTTMERAHRNLLLDGKLVLVSPYDPSAGFNVGNAMQRNKLIYALAEASLVVSSDFNKGGTWAGAVEQLEKLKFVPVYVRSTGEPSAGIDALRKKGAISWPNPQNVEAFEAVFDVEMPAQELIPQIEIALFSNDEPSEATPAMPVLHELDHASQDASKPKNAADAVPDEKATTATSEKLLTVALASEAPLLKMTPAPRSEATPAEMLFTAVREAVRQLLPMRDTELATALDVSNAQAKAWLQRLVDEEFVEKQRKPAVYIVRQKRLL